MAGKGISIPIVYQLFFLVPGYFTYYLAVRVGRIRADFDRFDKLMISLSASAISVTIVYVAYIIILSHTSQQGGFTAPSPLTLPFSHLALGFGSHVLLTILAGGLIGKAISHNRREDVSWHHPWMKLHQNLGSAPSIKVLMSDGKLVEGELVGYERSHDSQDLRLVNASVQNDGDEPSGEDVYLYGDDIVRIWILSEIDED
jgi:small nuclear ribonucleoprotein (snRNP)-like protein